MIDLSKLRKVHALTSSPNPHEAAAARGKVDVLLAAAGKTRAELLAAPAPTMSVGTWRRT